METKHHKKVRFKISGMHCASCEVLIEQKFRELPGVEKVTVNHANGKADLICSEEPGLQQLQALLKEDGYTISSWQDRNRTAAVAVAEKAPEYAKIGWMFLAVVSLYYVLKQFDFLPNISVTEHMSYGLILLIGLFAAVSSCIAVVGGLLLGLAAKYNESHPDLTGLQRFKPHLYFNVGRIAGYTAFGAAVGALGSVLSLSPRANGYLMVVVSIVMLLLGFQLLNLFPGLRRFSPKMPKFIAHKIHDLSAKESRGAPFALGASTFFLPCGFTQALQLYVLASGDWKVGALTMLTFSLGTLPALLSLSAVSSFAKGAFQNHFLRFAGVLIVLLSVFNINNGLALAGYDVGLGSLLARTTSASASDTPVRIVDGKQIVKMTVKGYAYTPNKFTVIEGVPVEWQIDGTEAAGCGRVLVMPTLGTSKYLLPQGITTVTFTPTQTGTIPFNCSMGMMTRGSQFVVVENTKGIVGAKIDDSAAPAGRTCDPAIASCPKAQKLSMEVSREKGIYPRSLNAKKGLPVELTIDDKVALGGCMGIWVIPKYNITIPMNGTVSTNTFTPTETGTVNITCSMGSKIAEINITD